ncbi:hypothetical protein SANTM175S_00449 [Streptomyces antimycoticus]
MVEILTVLARSPPVPTMSTVSPGTSITLAWSYMARTRPATSETVSPLARSAIAKPAIWASVASPRMIRSMAQAVSSASRSRPAISEVSTSGQVRAVAVLSPPAGVTTSMVRSWIRGVGREGAAHVSGPPPAYRQHDQGPGRTVWSGPGPWSVASADVRERYGGDQWWPWPLVISWYSSRVGFGMTLSSP